MKRPNLTPEEWREIERTFKVFDQHLAGLVTVIRGRMRARAIDRVLRAQSQVRVLRFRLECERGQL